MTAEHFCLGVFVTKYPDGDESFNALCKCTRTFGEFDTKPEARRSLLGHVARMAGIKESRLRWTYLRSTEADLRRRGPMRSGRAANGPDEHPSTNPLDGRNPSGVESIPPAGPGSPFSSPPAVIASWEGRAYASTRHR